MRTEGFGNTARRLMFVAAILSFSHPVQAQRPITVFPRSDMENRSPISFMRPHFLIDAEAGTSPSAPPTSALAPAQVRRAYGFDRVNNQGHGQMIGIVDAYDDPNIESDLGVFNKQYGLPACTAANGCFRKVYSHRGQPAANANWAVEIALDVEWAHAIAPQAVILLVEAPSNSFSDLLNGVDVAVRDGASVVSMSWMAGEFQGENFLDNHFVSNGVTFLAASGDGGTGVAYPAASPNVIGVGGTSLSLNAGGNYQSEIAWSGSGGGLSTIEREPSFQAQLGVPDDSRGFRGIPDVSYNANPGTGYAIYDSLGVNRYSGWFQVGGTSAGTPQWAALIAIANSMRAAQRKANLTSTNTPLYSIAKSAPGKDFHAVTRGSNGACGQLCTAMPGYDYITGMGTPQANVLIGVLAAAR
jgi:subtilase family serine protease